MLSEWYVLQWEKSGQRQPFFVKSYESLIHTLLFIWLVSSDILYC